MPALLTKISGELTRNNINNNNNNNICLPPNVETWITEPSNCHLAVLLYINFNSRENRVNNMWSFKRNTSFFEYYLVPFPEFQPSAGDFFKKKCIRKSSTGLRVCSWFPSSVIVFLCHLLSVTWTEQTHTLPAHRRSCFARWNRKPDKMNVDHLSLRVFFSREKVATSMFRFRLVWVGEKNTNTFTPFMLLFLGRKGVGVYLFIFFIVISSVKWNKSMR